LIRGAIGAGVSLAAPFALALGRSLFHVSTHFSHHSLKIRRTLICPRLRTNAAPQRNISCWAPFLSTSPMRCDVASTRNRTWSASRRRRRIFNLSLKPHRLPRPSPLAQRKKSPGGLLGLRRASYLACQHRQHGSHPKATNFRLTNVDGNDG
jgi:hypothetical protein